MIKANELRIGNLIQSKISGNRVILTAFYIFQAEENEIFFNKLYKPTSITPEWLERFGFEKVEENSVGVKYSIVENGVFNSDLCLVYWTDTEAKGKVFRNRKEIKYIHQLQNLYFALTGEELKLEKQ